MRTARGDATSAQLDDLLPGAGDVYRLWSLEMSALDEYDARPQLEDSPGGIPHVVQRPDAAPGQSLGLRDIRRDHLGQREQQGLERLHGVILNQACPSLRDHHRIDDDVEK